MILLLVKRAVHRCANMVMVVVVVVVDFSSFARI